MRHWFVWFFAVIAISAGIHFYRKSVRGPIDFNYVAIGCTVFDINGKVIFNKYGSYICDFSEDGNILVHESGLYDQNDKLMSSLDKWNHHDMKFSPDNKSYLIIRAQDMIYKEQKVKFDCAQRVNFNGKLEAQWCLRDHLDELSARGIAFEPWPTYGILKALAPVEISHANSIYEIPDNRQQSENPALAAGNYIFNLYGFANLIVITDHEMKKTLWVTRMNEFPWSTEKAKLQGMSIAEGKNAWAYQLVATHDDQILPDGSVLSFATLQEPLFPDVFDGLTLQCFYRYINYCPLMLQEKEYLSYRSAVIRWNLTDPKKDFKIVWLAPKRKNLNTVTRGVVRPLRNGNYFIFCNEDSGQAIFVVDPDGKEVWQFKKPPGRYGPFNPIFVAQPLYKEGFLAVRGI